MSRREAQRLLALRWAGNDRRAFIRGYLEAILWADAFRYADRGDAHEEPELETYSDADADTLTWDALRELVRDARVFYAEQEGELVNAVNRLNRRDGGDTWGLFGHEFALSRNGHGTGLWDLGLDDLGDRLHAAAKVHGPRSVVLNGDALEILE